MIISANVFSTEPLNIVHKFCDIHSKDHGKLECPRESSSENRGVLAQFYTAVFFPYFLEVLRYAFLCQSTGLVLLMGGDRCIPIIPFSGSTYDNQCQRLLLRAVTHCPQNFASKPWWTTWYQWQFTCTHPV